MIFILIEPYAIEPLFYKFTPLQKTQPALVERIEAMLNHAGLSIPPARIFEMDASSRTKEVDAYVSGLGSSKRVVVWDTTLKAMGPDELLLVLGHETGHYALYHIPKEFALDEAVALVFFFLGFFAVNWLVAREPARARERRGDRRFGITSPRAHRPHRAGVLVGPPGEWHLAPLRTPGRPVRPGSGLRRRSRPNAAEVHALQILGEEDLSDPDPSPFIKFWLYTHPPLDERIRFAATYKPWAEGKPMELLPQHR